MIQQPSSASYSAIVRVILRGGGGGGGSSSRRTAAVPTSSSIFLGGRCCSLVVSSTSNGASASAIMESRNNTSNDARLLFSTRRYSSSSFSSTIANNININHDGGQRPSSSEHRNQEKKEERIRKAILSAALHHVHDMGWTDDAIANGVLDCAYPPSYIGRVLSSRQQQSSSPSSNDYSIGVWGNGGQLVAHFMEECNHNLRNKLSLSLPPPATSTAAESSGVRRRRDEKKIDDGVILLASRINNALRLRLSMVLPYIHSKRWHEGMAIGALPQNAVMTMSQLNDMADIVLSYATTRGATIMGGVDNYSSNNNNNNMHKVAIVAAYAAAELHLLSSNVTTTSTTTSLSGDRYDDTWTFLEARSTGAAHVIINGGIPSFDNLLPKKDLAMITSSNIQAASAMTSSLLGAILSLATPTTASMIGRVGGSSTAVVLPQVLDSVMGLVQSFAGTGTTMTQMMNNANSSGGGVGVDSMMKRGDTIIGGNKMKGDGTRASDYAAIEETLPPFDTKEEIFLAPSARSDIK